MSAELLNKEASIGHNNPPEIADQVAQEQSEKYAEKLREYERLLAKRSSLPTEVTNDEQSGEISDWVKLVKALKKEIDLLRQTEKKKYTVWSDAIQNFWKRCTDKLEDTMASVSAPNDAYLQKKKDEEARKRAEEARIKQEEADRKLREAQEKERIAQEILRKEREERERVEREQAEAQRRREAEQAEILRKAQEEADRKIREANERAEAARQREEALRKEMEAQRAREKLESEIEQAMVDAEEEDRQRTIKKELEEAERQRKEANKEIRVAAKEAGQILKEASKEVRAIEMEGRQEEVEIAGDLHELTQEARQAERELGRAMDTAIRADKEFKKAEKQTLAGTAEMTRTRGFGSVASLREDFEIEMSNRDELDFNKIKDFFTPDAVNQALRGWLRANTPHDHNTPMPTIKGAIITQVAKSVVR